MCGCYAFAPFFAIDVMWRHQAKHPTAIFDEPEFRNPHDKSGLGFSCSLSNPKASKKVDQLPKSQRQHCSLSWLNTKEYFDFPNPLDYEFLDGYDDQTDIALCLSGICLIDEERVITQFILSLDDDED